MTQKIILKLGFRGATYKLEGVELTSISQLQEYAKSKFGDQIQDCMYNAKFEKTTQSIVKEHDIAKVIGLATANKKGMKVLTIKMKKAEAGQTPVKSQEKATDDPSDNDLLYFVDTHFKAMVNRKDHQYDNICNGFNMACKSDKIITFTGGKYKLFTRENDHAFNSTLDHPNNLATKWSFDFYDHTNNTTMPVVLQVYADYSVHLFDNTETIHIAWGSIKSENRTNVALYLTFDKNPNQESPAKLVSDEKLMCVNNKYDNTELYVFPGSARFGVIPSESFDLPMQTDGLFFSRSARKQKTVNNHGVVIHPSIHKAGEFSSIKCIESGDFQMRFANQANPFEPKPADNKNVARWADWDNLKQQQKEDLVKSSKTKAAKKFKKQHGTEYDPDNSFQNFTDLIYNKLKGNISIVNDQEAIFKLFLSMKDDMDELLKKKVREFKAGDQNEENGDSAGIILNDDENLKHYKNPKSWMQNDWDNQRHQKWLHLVENYPKVNPYKIGNMIKSNPRWSLIELDSIVDRHLKLSQQQQTYENPRLWMSDNWDLEKYAKWLKLCEWMPIKEPFKFGEDIKEYHAQDANELKDMINKRISDRVQPITQTFDKDEMHFFEIFKEVIPGERYFCAKAVVKNRHDKLGLEEFIEKTLVMFMARKEKNDLKKKTLALKKKFFISNN